MHAAYMQAHKISENVMQRESALSEHVRDERQVPHLRVPVHN
jgi:hypothetical protein